MNNVKLTVKGKTLHIEVDLTKTQGPSSTGKTEIIATTRGNVQVPEHHEVLVGLNVYKYMEPRK
jgi:hypothetical protein